MLQCDEMGNSSHTCSRVPLQSCDGVCQVWLAGSFIQSFCYNSNAVSCHTGLLSPVWTNSFLFEVNLLLTLCKPFLTTMSVYGELYSGLLLFAWVKCGPLYQWYVWVDKTIQANYQTVDIQDILGLEQTAYVWYFRCITCVEQVYYTYVCHTCISIM